MPKPAETRLSDAALLALPVSILTAAVLVVIISALLPGLLVLRGRYACEEPLLLTAELTPVTLEGEQAQLLCLQPNGSYTVYAPGWSVFFSWLTYFAGTYIVFFGIFARKSRRRRKKR